MIALPDGVTEGARELLDRNWREGICRGRRYGFSVPSPSSYPWQWYWDSCFHAIVRARWEPERARRELRTLIDASEDGFIGHTVFWGDPPSVSRAVRYNMRCRGQTMTSTIQPPALAWAWRIAVGDPRSVPGIAAHHDWLRANRDLDGDGLLWLISPDESGLDALPKFDRVWGHEAQGLPGFLALIARNRRLGFDARCVQAAGRPVCCEVLTNVIFSLSEQALGRPSITPALVDRLYDERLGRFFDSSRNPTRELAPDRRPLCWDTLAPLALPDLPERIGHRLVHETLIPRFSTAVPLAAVAPSERCYSERERFWGLRRHWRGPSWVNSAWLVSLGLRRLGYGEIADGFASRLGEAIHREGFREYYRPGDGRGMSAREFGWSSLIVELADPSAISLQAPAPGETEGLAA